ncbi:dihydrolipoamide acetyltransferase family protein [Actinoplanes sp. NPDC051411]|uniref:dihydrolipoamide acetyltransferase family protein n=1 Tax=Actinoplanes sp. NPDC051411 TaxID=3155522 RepID=UPI003433A286
MPEISANMVEAVVNEWPVAENTTFAAGDAIATVETDKAVVDVPAEADGVLLRTLVEPGKPVSVGTPMAVLAAPGEVIGDLDALVESLLGEAPATAAPPAAGAVTSAAGPVRLFSSPLARRLARENGLRIEDIAGTGPEGRIVRDDVHRALADRIPVPASPAPPPAGAAPTPRATATDTGYDAVPHSRMRRAIAARLSAAARETPVFTIRGSARVDALLALRTELNAAGDTRISVNDLIVAAAARSHVAVPDMNVVWTDDAVHRFHDVAVSIAVATDSGLVTPVVRHASELTVSALARTSADLVARARDHKLRQDELDGGTLTVTNLGVYGTEEFSAVINPPQAAILAVGAARKEAVVVDGQIDAATVLRVTLSVDHRPVDGALAARWMAHFLGLLEAPLRILA